MKPGDIDFSKVTFSSPKMLENGGKMIYLNYGGGINPLYVKVPEGTLPFDPNYFPDDGIDDPENEYILQPTVMIIHDIKQTRKLLKVILFYFSI